MGRIETLQDQAQSRIVKRPLVALSLLAISVLFADSALAERYPIGVCIPESEIDIDKDESLTKADKEAEKLAVRALKLYQKMWGKKHRHDGNTIQLVFGDLEKHKEAGVLAVVGQLFSRQVAAETSYYEKEKIVYVTPSASDPPITEHKPLTFSMINNDRQQASMIANFLRYVLKCKSVLVVYKTNSYGYTLRSGFLPELFPNYREIPFDSEKASFQNFVVKSLKPSVKESNPDVIVFFTYPQKGKEMIKELRELHGEDDKIPIPVICPESFYKERDFMDTNYGPNVYVTTPFIKEFGTNRANELSNAFEQEYPGKTLTLYPFLACEALDVLMQAVLEVARQNPRADTPVLREKIGTFLDAMRSPADAQPGMSGPLFFDNHAIHRPVIMALLSEGIPRPMSIQIQETAVTGNPGKKYLDDMEKKGRVIKGDGKKSEKYLKIIPVVYTRMTIRRLSNFDLERRAMEVQYRVCLTWPHDVYALHAQPTDESGDLIQSTLEVESIDLIEPEPVSKSSTRAVVEGYRHYPGYPNTRLHSYRCYDRKAVVHWDPDLSFFPFDVQRMRMKLGSCGQNANEIVLAVDNEHRPKDESEPEVDDQFQFVHWSSSSDSNSTYLDRETSKLIDPITGQNLYYYVSIYEKQFVLKRNLALIPVALLFLPLALAGAWYVVWHAVSPLPVGTIPGGIAFTLFLALHGWCVAQYKIPPLSPLNMSFLTCYVIIFGTWIANVVDERRSTRHDIGKQFHIVLMAVVVAYSVYIMFALIKWVFAGR